MMRRMVIVHATLLAVVLLGASAAAQAQMCGVESMMAQAGPPEASTGQPPMPGGQATGQGMCRICMMPMMAQTEGPMGMMGMMGDGKMDAKTRGRMLQMRGEMLKAMGEVMMKHGQAMSGEQ
jgi:hypothetical protein